MSWTHLSDSTPVARKRYRCYLCGLAIEQGEQHVRRTGVEGGKLDSIRMHDACETLSQSWGEDEWECLDRAWVREQLAEAKAAKEGASDG